MTDPVITVVQKARDAGLIDDRAAQTLLALHRQDQNSDLADAPEAVRQATERLGKFVLVEKIGEGGMGTVWKAWQTDLRRTVAIKFVKDDDPELLDRFIREARTAAGLSHPNIVATFDAGEIEGRHFISMDYIEGDDLKKRRVDVPTALALMQQAAEAVHYAHRQGIVHRDLKPANLMLDSEGRVRVMDFGLAKSEAAPGLSMTGTVVGTPYYMPPEQAKGMPTDARSDVYALGATLYELVTGHPPFAGKTLGEVLRLVIDEEPAAPRTLNPKLDRDVETIIQKAMEKEPGKRYETAKQMAEDLRREIAGEPIAARPLGRVGRAVKWSKRNPAPAALVALAAAALLAVTGWAGTREWSRSSAIADARKAIAKQDWDAAENAASAGLTGAPEDTELKGLLDTARAGVQNEEARKRRAAWEAAVTLGLPEMKVREQKLAAEAPDHAPPSKKEDLWDVRRELRKAERDSTLARETAVQFALAALTYDRNFEPARTLVTEISWHEYEKAERERDLERQAVMESMVREHGGDEYAARLEAPATLELAAMPADATAYLFRYVEDKNRLVPAPFDAKDKIEWPSVDPLPIDAAATDKKRVREGTRYPLRTTDDNRVAFPLSLPAGSYLVLLRREGFDDLRLPVQLPRGGQVKLTGVMDRAGEAPAGFVRVAAGAFIAGRDPRASDFTGEPRTNFAPEVDDFYLQRFSVTVAEYLEFLNDRGEHDVEKAFEKSPRTASEAGYYWEKRGDRIATGWAVDWPVFGISWHDATAYAAWYTKKHPSTSLGVNWKFELPSEDEWEKAARGVDGRFFPYGDEFEAAFSAMLDSREKPEGQQRQPEPYGLFPADESPYGLRDTAGVIRNWTATKSGGGIWYVVKGGSWATQPAWCRSAYRHVLVPTTATASYGVRLAARRLPVEDF